MSSTVLERLTSLLPPERVLSQPEQLGAYESDGLTAYRARPLAIAIPETTDEVIALVGYCHAERLAFVARGSGTSLSGGSLPVAGGIIIALNRLNRILRLDPAARVAVVEAGVVNTQVQRMAAAPYGLRYAPDPSSQTICTIGGNVAFNAGGAHCLKYGADDVRIMSSASRRCWRPVKWFCGGAATAAKTSARIGADSSRATKGLFGIALGNHTATFA